MNEVKKTHALPGGGKVTVTIKSPEPINEADYFLLREDGATGMAQTLMNLAETMRPKQ